MDCCQILETDQKAVMIDFQDAGRPGPNHRNAYTGMKTHFVQAHDHCRVPINFDNDADFASSKKFKGQDL